MTASDHYYREAIEYLRELIEQAQSMGEPEPTAATLATADSGGRPSARIIHVARIEEAGLLFFANSASGKGRQMQDNPRAALCYFWPTMQEQALIEGGVEMLPEAESDTLWLKRPREAQLGAWVSHQGDDAIQANSMKEKLQAYKKQFDNVRVPRPSSWRGFRLHPDRLAFWPSGWHRLRARMEYRHDAATGWQCQRQQP